MRYRDLTADVGNRFRLPTSHPILAEITIDPADCYELQRLDADNPATHIVGNDAPQNEQMNVNVASASDAVRIRVEDGWSERRPRV